MVIFPETSDDLRVAITAEAGGVSISDAEVERTFRVFKKLQEELGGGGLVLTRNSKSKVLIKFDTSA